jgi:hypothetical protein
MPITAELEEYLASKKRDFFAASVYRDDLVTVKELGSVDAMQAFLLLNKWRKFSLHPNFKGRQDGLIDVPEKTRHRWALHGQSWLTALQLLQNADLVDLEKDGDGTVVVRLLTDIPRRP